MNIESRYPLLAHTVKSGALLDWRLVRDPAGLLGAAGSRSISQSEIGLSEEIV